MRWIVGLALCGAVSVAGAQSVLNERLTHQYWSVSASPDAKWVVDIEGDSPLGGYYPALRDLVIRGVRDGQEIKVQLPCGRVPECWPDSPAWSQDSKHVSFTLRSPGSHARSIYQVDADGSQLTKVLEFNGTIQSLRYLKDGRLSMLATQDARKEVGATEAGTPIAGDLDAASPEQRIAVLEQGALRFISPSDLYVYEYDASGPGSFVGTAAHGDGDNNYWTAKLYAFSAGEARVIYSPAGNQEQLAAPKVSRDGGSVAFIAGIMSDFGSVGGDVFLLNLAGGTPVNLTAQMHASARALGWQCDGRLEAELLAGNKTQIVELDSREHRQPPKILWSAEESFGRRADPLSTACPSQMRAMVHESFTTAPEIAVGALGHTHDLTHGNAGLTLAAQVQSVWWKNDGFDVQGWLLLPQKHGAKIPMVTQVHGGPAAAATPSFIGPGTQRSLLEHGYALFYPNPRGSYGQGERFTRANVRDFGYGDLRDILAGIEAAAKAAPIDLDRLGLTGGSYGGFMTMWAVTQTNRFKAAVAGAGISDWLSYYGENGIDAWMIPYFGASAYDDPDVYARSSAIHYMHNVKTPTFAYVGERDIECPAAQTQEFWHAMKAMHVPTEVMIYPGEGHGLRDPKHLEDETRRTLEWFDRYLK
ncbi:MAG TPA: prolyl oligopeptidase family serine peptidase [Steroidobacteraceae bacterium]|jgi:dienelactone hydrolase